MRKIDGVWRNDGTDDTIAGEVGTERARGALSAFAVGLAAGVLLDDAVTSVPCKCGELVAVSVTFDGAPMMLHPLPACAWFDATPADAIVEQLDVGDALRAAGFDVAEGGG